MTKVCGECRFFRVVDTREHSRIGNCRLERVMGVFREDMAACPAFSVPGDTALPDLDTRRVTGRRRQSQAAESLAGVHAAALATAMEAEGPDRIKAALGDLLDALLVAPKRPLSALCSGVLKLEPADRGLKAKEIPFDQVLQKGFAVRDNLRILEQKVNSAGALNPGQTLVYHSLITQVQATVLDFCCGWQAEASRDPEGDVLEMLRELVIERQRKSIRSSRPSLGERWRGGRVSYETKEQIFVEPMSRFFHRLVVMRDALLSLEAALEAETVLEPGEIKVMSGYLRRSKGSLTTFNILFKDRADYFSSGRG